MKTYFIIFNGSVTIEGYNVEAEKCDYDNDKAYFIFTKRTGNEIVAQIKKEYVVGIIVK